MVKKSKENNLSKPICQINDYAYVNSNIASNLPNPVLSDNQVI